MLKLSYNNYNNNKYANTYNIHTLLISLIMLVLKFVLRVCVHWRFYVANATFCVKSINKIVRLGGTIKLTRNIEILFTIFIQIADLSTKYCCSTNTWK